MLKKGFTLIELLIVITILAILAGAVLPYVQHYVEESRVAKAKADLDEIAHALLIYEARESEYNKPNIADLTGRYLTKAPVDPWGSPYLVNPGSGDVICKGPDRMHSGNMVDVTGKPFTSDRYPDAASDVNDDQPELNADDIVVSYLPPLALVSAAWIDRNQSSRPDTQGNCDKLQLKFSRRLDCNDMNTILGEIFLCTRADATQEWEPTPVTNICTGHEAISLVSRTFLFPLCTHGAGAQPYEIFKPGRDAVMVSNPSGTIAQISDLASPEHNACIFGQPVMILAQ